MARARGAEQDGRMANRSESSGMIVAIGVFKLVKAVLLLVAGLGALKLVGGGAPDQIEKLLEWSRSAPARGVVQKLVARLGVLSEKQLQAIAFGTFAYAALFVAEGVGLLLRKPWGEWLTVIVTGSFIPFEVWHAVKHGSAGSILTIAVNLAIVVYLIVRIRKRRR